MTRSLWIVIALATAAHADGSRGKGPCADADACEAACNRGTMKACTWGGNLLIQSGLDANKDRARRLFDNACNKGDGDACWRAGFTVDPGEGAALDLRAKARVYYDRGCTRGSASSCMT